MKCPTCGKELNADARFCGGCGARTSTQTAATATPEPASSATAPPSAPEPFVDTNAAHYSPGTNVLRADLRKLHAAFVQSGITPFLQEALGALAQGPSLEPPVTLIMGDYRRGKTTLANRLLGANILGVRPGGEQHAVRIVHGPAWRALGGDDGTVEISAAPPFSQPNELDDKSSADAVKAFTRVEGPSELLKTTTLIDAPGGNDTNTEFETQVIGEAIRADIVVVCLAATMPLSEAERVTIQHRLLPVVGGDILAVVTMLDQIENETDRQDVEARIVGFASRVGNGRIRPVFNPGGAQADLPAEPVRQAIVEIAERRSAHRESAWAGKIAMLLGALKQAAEALPEASAAPEALEQGEVADLLGILEAEHKQAYRETIAQVKLRMARIRTSLPERIAVVSPQELQREGLAELTGEVQSIAAQSGAYYLTKLEGGLTRGAPQSLHDSVAGLSQTAASHISPRVQIAVDRDKISADKPSSKEVLILNGLGLLLIIGGGSLLPIAGGFAALFGAHRIKKAKTAEFAEKLRVNSEEALRVWIDEAEADILAQLKDATGRVLTALKERIKIVAAPPAPANATAKPLTKPELLEAVERCREACGLVERSNA